MSSTSHWSYVDGYMTQFCSMSHHVMTSDAPGRPPRPAHGETLNNEQAKDDHVIYVLSICQNIM